MSSIPEINESLHEFAKRPLDESRKRKFSDVQENEEDDDEIIKEEPRVTDKTKSEIYNLLQKNVVDDPEKYIKLVECISNFNEKDANAFLEILRSAGAIKTRENLSKKALDLAAKYIPHPLDPDTPEEIRNDEFLTHEISRFSAWALGKFGPFAAIIVLGIYGAASWQKYQPEFWKKKRSSSTTVQNDDMREESHGQDNSIR